MFVLTWGRVANADQKKTSNRELKLEMLEREREGLEERTEI